MMGAQTTDELIIDRAGTTLNLTLNRPGKMNALSASLVDLLIEQVEAAASSGVRLMVLKGAGRNFSAGFDFGGYEEQTEGDLVLRFLRIEQLLQAVHHARFDTMALVHGRNFGAGVDLVCACNNRIGDPAASFHMPGLSFGIVLGTRRFAARVGAGRARSVLADGVAFDAEEGLASGFLTKVVPSAEWNEALRTAAETSTRLSPQASVALDNAVRRDTRAEDLADLAVSAARPGLKARIAAYRA